MKKDLDPLDKKCSCYACQRHSESYIAHLISCFELNAKVLLSIHNLQIYIDFINSFWLYMHISLSLNPWIKKQNKIPCIKYDNSWNKNNFNQLKNFLKMLKKIIQLSLVWFMCTSRSNLMMKMNMKKCCI